MMHPPTTPTHMKVSEELNSVETIDGVKKVNETELVSEELNSVETSLLVK